jgi:hypothetical protein
MVQVVENQYARAMEGVAFWGRRVHEVERRRGVGASGSGSGSGSGGLSAGGGVAGSPGGTASGGGISGDRIWTSLTTGMQYFSAAERERDFSSSVATAAADTHVLERYAAYSAYAIALRECVAAARTVEAQAQQIWDEAARRAAMFPELVAEGV